MHNWTSRYWGPAIYEQLLAIKKAHDPGNHFWCHHCVGDNPDDAYGEPLSSA
jgi:ribonuclease T2